MKEIITYTVSVCVAGAWRNSPEYPTPEQACAMILPFVKKLNQRFTKVTIVRNVRYVAVEPSK